MRPTPRLAWKCHQLLSAFWFIPNNKQTISILLVPNQNWFHTYVMSIHFWLALRLRTFHDVYYILYNYNKTVMPHWFAYYKIKKHNNCNFWWERGGCSSELWYSIIVKFYIIIDCTIDDCVAIIIIYTGAQAFEFRHSAWGRSEVRIFFCPSHFFIDSVARIKNI